MLRAIKALNHSSIIAIDGELGSVQDIYLDDEKWTIRYLVVRAGSWLSAKNVLISPISVRHIDWEHHRVEVSLSCEQIRSSPDVDADKPVSRQKEIQFFDYYRWPYYWTGTGIWGIGPYPSALGDAPIAAIPDSEMNQMPDAYYALQNLNEPEVGDPHLRSCHELEGYRISAIDSDFGHVEGLVMDDQTWAIRYFIIHTKNFFPSKSVLLSTEWVDMISWSDQKIRVQLNSDTIKNCPEFISSEPITRTYEELLGHHYGHRQYAGKRYSHGLRIAPLTAESEEGKSSNELKK